MNAVIRRTVPMALLGALLFAPGAWAYFPIGEFDAAGVLYYATWRLAAMDTNNDGEVGPNEGVDVFIEEGPRGFTPEELVVVNESLDVWEDVTTSYASAAVQGEFQDLILAGVSDGQCTIQMEVPEDPSEIQVGVISDPAILGLTIITFVAVDSEIDVNGITGFITAGTIIDADIVMDGPEHRPFTPGELPFFNLEDTLVHEIGHFYGLGHVPNSTVKLDDQAFDLVESADFKTRDAFGNEVFVGLTPTMFPYYFQTRSREGGSAVVGGASTLAPDDISGISFLYPRGSQAAYFDIDHRARTQNRADIPSFPLPAAVVTAWIDHDNDPTTGRQPFVSTMTGLYESALNVERGGDFELRGLWKRIEVEGAPGLVDATYSLTLSPVNGTGFERMAPAPYLPPDFNSITNSGATLIVPFFVSETFNEFGNLVDISEHDAGTALKWDSVAGAVMSQDSGKTLAQILPNRGEPMFGDANQVCPFNVVFGDSTDTGTGTDTGQKVAGMLRGFRDDVLLKGPFGAAFVDAYYTVSPSLAEYLGEHRLALRAVRAVLRSVGGAFEYSPLLPFLLVPVAFLVRPLYRRARLRMAAAALTMIGLLIAAPAMGLTVKSFTTADMASNADVIVVGTVSAVESRWVKSPKYGEYIVTDISIDVSESAKGAANKNSSLSFTMPGGRVDTIATAVPGLAQFAEGEEVLLYLVASPNLGYVVIGGAQGKVPVGTEKATGAKYVPAGAVAASPDDEAAKALVAKASQKDGQPPRIPLNVYLDYLRTLIDAQEQAKVNAAVK